MQEKATRPTHWGSELAIIGDSNITTTVSQGQAAIALNKDLKDLTSVETTDGAGNTSTMTAGGTKVDNAAGDSSNYTANGATITGSNGKTVTLASDKVDVGGNTINNVAAGVDGKDAVNKDQLDALQAAGTATTDKLGESTAKNLGGGSTYDKTTGEVKAPSYTVQSNPNDASTSTTVNNVGAAIDSLNTAVTTPLTFKDAGKGNSTNPLG